MTTLKKLGNWLLHASIFLILCLAALAGIYSGWVWWDLKQLRGFCGEVKNGAGIDILPALADNHGIDRRWIDRRVTLKHGSAIIVPAASTMGDVRCTIHHDGKAVLSVEQPQAW